MLKKPTNVDDHLCRFKDEKKKSEKAKKGGAAAKSHPSAGFDGTSEEVVGV